MFYIETNDYDDVLVNVNIADFIEEESKPMDDNTKDDAYEQMIQNWFKQCADIARNYSETYGPNAIVPTRLLPLLPKWKEIEPDNNND
jgi:hypothetical protein